MEERTMDNMKEYNWYNIFAITKNQQILLIYKLKCYFRKGIKVSKNEQSIE